MDAVVVILCMVLLAGFAVLLWTRKLSEGFVEKLLKAFVILGAVGLGFYMVAMVSRYRQFFVITVGIAAVIALAQAVPALIGRIRHNG